MELCYRKREYVIYTNKHNGFIIHNTKKPFKTGHTHINNYNTAKFIIDLCIHKTIPDKKISSYIINSCIRVSDKYSFIKQLKEYNKSIYGV